jgi:hypothetical protein
VQVERHRAERVVGRAESGRALGLQALPLGLQAVHHREHERHVVRAHARAQLHGNLHGEDAHKVRDDRLGLVQLLRAVEVDADRLERRGQVGRRHARCTARASHVVGAWLSGVAPWLLLLR